MVFPSTPLLNNLSDIPYCLAKKNGLSLFESDLIVKVQTVILVFSLDSTFLVVMKPSQVFGYNINTRTQTNIVSASNQDCQVISY